MMSTTGQRGTAADRRAAVLDAAFDVFAERGLYGASTEEIARRAGISQPYVFRLFGTKKELFKAVVTRCFRRTLEIFQQAAEGKRGEEALHAIGEAYGELLRTNRLYLRAQMQAYAACGDPELCEVVRAGYGDLVAYVERVSGADSQTIAAFFARGMLMNVMASMDLVDATDEPWVVRLLEGCAADL
jgi:AcrR family transcriptional regulator